MADNNSPEHKDVLDHFEACQDFWNPIYRRGEEDTDFALGNGKQWPEKIRKERERDNRPCLEENRMLPFVHQVINQIRQARPSIIPKPVDDKADIDTAEICRGLIRNIETQSDAGTVYDTAARNSVMASVGWIRVITDYADYDTFDQEIRYERIQNFKSVYLDPNHQRQDGADSRYGFVFEDMPEDDFKAEYPDATMEGFTNKGDWKGPDTVRVAEYFWKAYEEKELVEYEMRITSAPNRGIAFADKMPAGAVVLRKRKTHICTIKHRKLTGAEFLGEEGEFPGQYIPLVPVYGFETFTEGKRSFFSLVNPGKDPQRMLNYWISSNTEITALQPKAPYIGAVGQFSSYGQQWANANAANYPFLEYDPVIITGDDGSSMLAPAPQRSVPPSTSPGISQEIIRASEAIKSALGMFDAAIGNQSPDVSGKAIISRQMQGDNATFHFVDNLAVAIRQVGRITIGIIPIVYTGQRTIRILGEDGGESLVPLGRPVIKQGKGYRLANPEEEGKVISLDAGKYDVVVEVGASYATKRQELANAIVEIARVNPEIMNVAGDLFMKSLDVPHAEEIAKRIRATMDPALLGDDVEAQRLQMLTKALNDLQAKLQLTEEALLAKKNNEEFKNSLEAKKVENDTKKLMIDAAKAQAEIEKIQSEIGGNHEGIGLIATAIRDLKAQVDDVSTAMHVLLSSEEEEGSGAPPTPENESPDDAGRSIASVTA